MRSFEWKTGILSDGREVLLLDTPLKKTLLWHITSRCNLSCKYCYGSFTGGSYKETYFSKKDVPLEHLLETVDDLALLGFERAHINGGEPFERKDLWQLLRKLKECRIESFVLTNATFLPSGFEENFSRGFFTNLSFSLDSTDKQYNDWVRGNTTAVVDNIKEVVALRNRYGVPTELGLYCVVTRMNIIQLEKLINWALAVGLDYISLQLVYLPPSHKYYGQFVITSELGEKAWPVFEYLRSKRSFCRIPGDALFEITRQHLMGRKLLARNCFCERDISYLFIDGVGNVKLCPSKHDGSDQILGNIRETPLKAMVIPCVKEESICREFSLDCIGVWEMAHPTTFELHL